jgi:hypothetical protein
LDAGADGFEILAELEEVDFEGGGAEGCHGSGSKFQVFKFASSWSERFSSATAEKTL